MKSDENGNDVEQCGKPPYANLRGQPNNIVASRWVQVQRKTNYETLNYVDMPSRWRNLAMKSYKNGHNIEQCGKPPYANLQDQPNIILAS